MKGERGKEEGWKGREGAEEESKGREREGEEGRGKQKEGSNGREGRKGKGGRIAIFGNLKGREDASEKSPRHMPRAAWRHPVIYFKVPCCLIVLYFCIVNFSHFHPHFHLSFSLLC